MAAGSEGKDSLKARRYAFLLLKYRPRSEEELRQRLSRKRFDASTVESALDFLREKNLVNDEAFARAWIEERRRSGMGLARIERELRLKGVGEQIRCGLIRQQQEELPERPALESLARRRWEKLKKDDLPAAQRRLFGFLLRRGFLPEEIREVIEEL